MTRTPITDRILSHRRLDEANAIYLGRDERKQFDRETDRLARVTDAAILGLHHPDGAFAEFRGLDVYEVDASSHFGIGLKPETP